MGPSFYPAVLLEPGEDCVADKFRGTQPWGAAEAGWLQWGVKSGRKFVDWAGSPLLQISGRCPQAAAHTQRGREWLCFGLWLETGEVSLTTGLRLQAAGLWPISLKEMGKVTMGVKDFFSVWAEDREPEEEACHRGELKNPRNHFIQSPLYH